MTLCVMNGSLSTSGFETVNSLREEKRKRREDVFKDDFEEALYNYLKSLPINKLKELGMHRNKI
jgi:hypothetical protein